SARSAPMLEDGISGAVPTSVQWWRAYFFCFPNMVLDPDAWFTAMTKNVERAFDCDGPVQRRGTYELVVPTKNGTSLCVSGSMGWFFFLMSPRQLGFKILADYTGYSEDPPPVVYPLVDHGIRLKASAPKEGMRDELYHAHEFAFLLL